MQVYKLLLTVLGAVIILTAWMPVFLKTLPLSLPMVCIAIGVLLVLSPFSPVVGANPLEKRLVTERLADFVVIVALTGAGLKLDRPLSWRGWNVTWRLLGIAMPLTIAAIALLGWATQYRDRLHTFVEQTERLVMMILLVFFGAAIAEGSIFAALNWHVEVFALAVLLVVRPASGIVSRAGYKSSYVEKAVISFFGIRGLASFYYLPFALGKAEFEQADILWVSACFVMLVSILLHGVTVTPVMNFLDRRR